MAGASGCVFCEILAGASSAHQVWEDDACVAILDHRPLFPGHCLVIPREHHETLGDLPAALVPPLFTAARRLARAAESSLGAQGTFIGINNRVSQSVPHLHVHVVPRRRGDGLKGFFWPRHPYTSPQDMARVAETLRAAAAAEEQG